jgi:hypothetical protein
MFDGEPRLILCKLQKRRPLSENPAYSLSREAQYIRPDRSQSARNGGHKGFRRLRTGKEGQYNGSRPPDSRGLGPYLSLAE